MGSCVHIAGKWELTSVSNDSGLNENSRYGLCWDNEVNVDCFISRTCLAFWGLMFNVIEYSFDIGYPTDPLHSMSYA